MGLEIPPKPAVASVIGFLKGKRALASARRVHEKDRNFVGEHCWARGDAVATGGFELASGKKYIAKMLVACLLKAGKKEVRTSRP
jgi:putative transposase